MLKFLQVHVFLASGFDGLATSLYKPCLIFLGLLPPSYFFLGPMKKCKKYGPSAQIEKREKIEGNAKTFEVDHKLDLTTF